MQYRKDKHGEELSILGYGCMRFSRKGSGVDIDKTEQELLAAIRAGVNYLDTAYIYPGSEAALGEILERNGLRDQPEVSVVLSGMNSLAMVEENVRIASEAAVGAFTEEDRAFLQRILDIIREKEKVGCTGCRYCMPCPKGVDIPGYFSSYNLMYTESKVSGRRHFFQAVALSAEPAFASQCVQCRKCEKHCPQGIPIREQLKKAEKALLPWPVKFAVKLGWRFFLRRR